MSVESTTYKTFIPPRDFVGYGFEQPNDCWPNGAKICVSFVLNYEEQVLSPGGSEHTVWNGDKRSVEFLHEAHYHRSPVEGRRDLVVESMFEYGTRQGLPRILKLFKKFDWPFTVWANARALEVTEPYGKILVERGHEIACHGNRWRNTSDLSGPDEEAAHVKQSIARLQKASGLPDVPKGWFLGNGSIAHKHIRAKVHKEVGLPLLYCSDTYADDIPYWVPSPLAMDGEKDEGMLMIPYSLTNNDHRFLVANGTGVSASQDWFDLLKGDFDMLYEEGMQGHPKLMCVNMHNRLVGKPGRIIALKRFMEYIKDRPDVWITTRDKIAEHWREKYPYEKVGPTRNMHYND